MAGWGELPRPGGADLSQGGMCRRRRAGAERIGVRPQPEAQASQWPLPQPLHLGSDMALRRQGGEELIFPKRWANRGSSGSLDTRLGVGEGNARQTFPGDPLAWLAECQEVRPQLGSPGPDFHRLSPLA